MLRRLASIPRRAPLAFSVAYGGAKTIAADVLVQKYLEGAETIDQRRSLVFLGFGLFQVGFVQYMIYSKLFPFIFKGAGTFSQQTVSQMARDTQGLKNVLKQVGLDMLVYHPCCYFPVFYTCQEIVNGNVRSPSETIGSAMQKYIPNAVEDWIGLWRIFIPVSLYQNSFCPVYLRVPCVATAGFFYCIVLSMTRGAEVSAARTANQMLFMSDEEFEECLALIRTKYWTSKDGVGRDEFDEIMKKFGLTEASTAVFDALDDSEGLFPRGSGLVDVVRLVDGLKLLSCRCSPAERAEFLASNPSFVAEKVPARSINSLASMSPSEFEERMTSIRNRYCDNKDGVNREEFAEILSELGMDEASSTLFNVLDDSPGVHPRGSGVVDAVRLIDGLKLLCARCSPEERLKAISRKSKIMKAINDDPRSVASEVPPRCNTMSDQEFENCLASIRNREWPGKDSVDREEFIGIMNELCLGAASTALFDALDGSDGLYPRGSGLIDRERFIEGIKLLSGRCLPNERVEFLKANPQFLPEAIPPRSPTEGYK